MVAVRLHVHHWKGLQREKGGRRTHNAYTRTLLVYIIHWSQTGFISPGLESTTAMMSSSHLIASMNSPCTTTPSYVLTYIHTYSSNKALIYTFSRDHIGACL